MTIVIEEPLSVAGNTVQVVVDIEVSASRLPFGGIVASGSKRPVAVMFGTGTTARLIGLDGATLDPSTIGLQPEDFPAQCADGHRS